MTISFDFRTLFPAVAVCALVLAHAGCSSISVSRSDTVAATPPKKVPTKIFVQPFGFYDPGLRVDREGAELDAFKKEASERLAQNLAQRLSEHVAPAEVVKESRRLPRGNYWLITGRIERMYQGSRALRAVVGHGFGGTKLETTSMVYDLSRRPHRAFLIMETTGGSNAMPGAIGVVGYFMGGITALPAAGNMLEGLRSGVTFDTQRTSKEITATLSEFLYQQQAIPREKALSPKRPGRWQPDFWPFKNRPASLPAASNPEHPAKPE